MAAPLSMEEKMQLQKWIGDGKKSFELIFSIRRDGCDSTNFHSHCDLRGPTVTVLYNTNNSVFGGYTSVVWRSLGRYVEDKNAFLFQLRYNGKEIFKMFPHLDGKKAIYDDKNYGPYFGSGPDLFTFKKTVKKAVKGGQDYFNLNGKMKNSKYDMSRCENKIINNDNMCVHDLEVYLVNDVPMTMGKRRLDCWDEEKLKSLKCEVQEFSYPNAIHQANIVLIGHIAAGKSSFINTINSTFVGHYVPVASSGLTEDSLTMKFLRYPIWMNDKELPFVLYDTPGIEKWHLDELERILDGVLPSGYQLKDTTPSKVNTEDSLSCRSLKVQMHCVVLVIDGGRLNVIKDTTMVRIRNLQERLKLKEVPFMVLLTKVDKVCPLVNYDLSMIFDSEDILSLIDTASDVFGVPRGNVLLVKNYEEEHLVESNVDILALTSLLQLLRVSRGFIQLQNTEVK